MRNLIPLTLFALAVSAASLAAAGSAPSKAPGASITLMREASVNNQTVRLGDVAKVNCSDPALSKTLESLAVGQAPWPGQHIMLDSGLIRIRLKSAGINPDKVRFTEPLQVKVIRSSSVVSPEELIDAAKNAVLAAWRGEDRMECDVLTKPSPVKVRAGQYEIAPQTAVCPRSGMMTVPLEIRVGGSRERSVNVSVRVRVFRNVVVASNAVARGQTISAADLKMEEREAVGGSSAYVSDISAADGMRAVRNIPAGAILRNADLAIVPQVRRGGPVIVIAAVGRVTVQSRGTALEDGQMGQLVKVQPDGSKDVISAKVAGDGKVTMEL